ncbi:MAG: T9SS type A sorting domain-containing protein [Bacteroidales bacterium]|jgi:hypothetical protein|nr:T9SS type A sorting domain-containing protein [Bacteroidales bacterium]
MKKLFLLLSLFISVNIFAQTENSFKFSLEEKKHEKTTLKQKDQINNISSMREVTSLPYDKRQEVIKEIAEKGLSDNNQQKEKSGASKAIHERLDSIISYHPNGAIYNGQFITYDDEFRMIRLLNCNRVSNSWNTVEDYIYEYDENGNLTLYHTKVPEYGEESKKEYTYNDLNQIIVYVNTYKLGSTWYNNMKEEYDYDEDGNMIDVMISYDNGAGGWAYGEREAAAYDELGRQILWQSYSWTGSSWFGGYQDEYTYDDLGHQTSYVISYWNGSTWIYDMKYEHAYDGNNILTQLVAFWNGTNWNGLPNLDVYTEKTEFAYDESDREIEQIYYQMKNATTGAWVEEGSMYTVWTDLGNGETQSVKTSYDDDIVGGGQYYQMVTKKYNANGDLTYEEEEHLGWNSYTLDTFLYDENNNLMESKSWSREGGILLASLYLRFEYDNDNNPILQENYFGQGTGPNDWLLNAYFTFEYENNYRTRHLFNSVLYPDNNWGWGIDLDFSTPASTLIQFYTAEYFQDRHYDHKITHTYDYQTSGGNWYIFDFIRYYSDIELPDPCPVVTNLNVSFVYMGSGQATLTWTAPLEVNNPTYNVYRNNVLIAGNLTSATYTDSGFTPLFLNEWCVETICPNGGSEFVCVTGTYVPRYTITATSGTGGAITPSGNIVVSHGNDQTFNITTNTGYAISQVLIDGVNNPEAVNNAEYTFSNVVQAHAISVVFALAEYTITASAGNGGGITPSGNIGVNHGHSQTFTITPYSGYNILQVLVDGVNNAQAVANGTYIFENITSNHTIDAQFEAITFVVNASVNGGHGAISPSGEIELNYGSSQTFTFTPEDGYKVSSVMIDGVNNAAAVANGSYTFNSIIAHHTIIVSFEIKTYNISGSAGVGGMISPSGAIVVEHGANQTFTITPNTGYVIASVLIDGINSPSAVETGSYTFEQVTGYHSISAHFDVATYTITASVVGGNGAINPSGEIEVNHGSSRSFTFTPSTGYKIESVLIDGVNNPNAVANGNYNFTNITADHTITVSFEIKTYTITAISNGEGTIDPSGDIEVEHGTNQMFNMEPAQGYKINTLKIDNTTVQATDSYTFENITSNHTIEVTFVEDLGIDNIEIVKINIYPNPAQSYIIVESENIINNIQIFDMMGRIVLNVNNISNIQATVDISQLKTGVYSVNVDSKIFKIIKE